MNKPIKKDLHREVQVLFYWPQVYLATPFAGSTTRSRNVPRSARNWHRPPRCWAMA